ncbi:MAG: hypothetical protein ACLSEX_14425 [Blautia sp.]
MEQNRSLRPTAVQSILDAPPTIKGKKEVLVSLNISPYGRVKKSITQKKEERKAIAFPNRKEVNLLCVNEDHKRPYQSLRPPRSISPQKVTEKSPLLKCC